jgi:catalase
VHSYNKDGAMRYEHSGDQPVYAPNSHGGPNADSVRFGDPGWHVEGEEIVRAAAALHPEDDDFIQAGNLYRDVMTETDREVLVANLVAHLGDGVERTIQERASALWQQVDADLGRRIGEGLGLVIPDRVRIPG